MATWAELERGDPDLAANGRRRFERHVVFHATLMRDGSPRLHPVSPWFATGLLCVSFRATSPKVAELARDARYAMHSAQDPDDHDGLGGEFLVRGWMEQIGEDDPAVRAPSVRPDVRADVLRVLGGGGGRHHVRARPRVPALARLSLSYATRPGAPSGALKGSPAAAQASMPPSTL